MNIATPVLAALLFIASLVASTVLIVTGLSPAEVPAEIKTSMLVFGVAAVGSALPGTLKLGNER